MTRYVRANPELAVPNGTFPTQPALVRRVKAMLARLDDNPGLKSVTEKILWAEVRFSHKEPWPSSYRQGLEKYCRFLSSLEAVEPPLTADRFKWSDLFIPRWLEHTFYNAEGKEPAFTQDKEDLRAYLNRLPELTGPELFRMMEDEPERAKEAKQAALFGAQAEEGPRSDTLIYSVRDRKFYTWNNISFLRPFLERFADCDGFYLSLLRDQDDVSGRKGYVRFETDSIVMNLTDRRLMTIGHECMHVAQIIGNELLGRTEHAFDGLAVSHYSPTQQSKSTEDRVISPSRRGPPLPVVGKSLRPKSGLPSRDLSVDDSSYNEKPIEFYPWAYTIARWSLALPPSISLIERIALVACGPFQGIREPQLRFRLVKSALQYAKQGKKGTKELTKMDLDYLRVISQGDYLSFVFLGYLVRHFIDDPSFYKGTKQSKSEKFKFVLEAMNFLRWIYEREATKEEAGNYGESKETLALAWSELKELVQTCRAEMGISFVTSSSNQI